MCYWDHIGHSYWYFINIVVKDIDRGDEIFENEKLEATPVTRRYSLLDVNSIDYNVVKCNPPLYSGQQRGGIYGCLS